MWIVFDLDDTLVETTRVLTPFQYRRTLAHLASLGVALAKCEKTLSLLLRLDARSERASMAWAEGAELLGLSKEELDIALNFFYGSLPPQFPLEPLPGAKETLETLYQRHKLALVTVGEPANQLAKLERAGLEPNLFSKILVGSGDKRPHYLALLAHSGLPPEQVVVCGDRPLVDLLPAKELGCLTVQMRNGRGLVSPRLHEAVDLTIGRLKDLIDIVERMDDEHRTAAHSGRNTQS